MQREKGLYRNFRYGCFVTAEDIEHETKAKYELLGLSGLHRSLQDGALSC